MESIAVRREKPLVKNRSTRWKSERRWNEPVPLRELHPLESSAFHGALFHQLTDRPWNIL
jgi:hypothetical protein